MLKFEVATNEITTLH